MKYEVYPHTADAGVRGIGDTVSEAFEGAAMATFSIMADIEKVKPETAISIELSAESLEDLLVKWLNELISLSSLKGIVFSRFEVEVDEKEASLKGRAWGQSMKDVPLQEEVKAATYADLKVEKSNGQWVAQCIVDV
ncbi:archease [Tardisphaera miroshnichenkoae]